MNRNEILNELRENWNRRELRERRILIGVALIVISSLVFLLGVSPAMDGIKNLEKSLPELKSQAASMANMAAQYEQLAKNVAENIPPITRETIESTLSRRSIKTQSLTVSNDIVRFQVNVVAYSNMMEWILEMQKAARLTVEEAKVTALTDPGQVSIVITLRQQRSGS
ncbi:type II secretion system protein GspM [Undibacterium fentianense]|uniref:Type II secretion system protein M n=1 Tax=Undibacterium fentianense TaxID=2828728 RepID=A0A941DX43_9BURK|nr:type II secretion system protein GspM [Undibacterium fentianense]MBR7798410.1 type II secretion system protein M [Undibacterium fentianense]